MEVPADAGKEDIERRGTAGSRRAHHGKQIQQAKARKKRRGK